MAAFEFDTILVGGGLQNGLIALALRARRPDARVALIDKGSRLGGNHTWCFHAGDLSEGARSWVAPLISHGWPGYHVVFPNLRRQIDEEYSAITSDRLHEVVSRSVEGHPGSALLLSASVSRVEGQGVVLDDGRSLSARIVVDARGPEASQTVANARFHNAGFQKFHGLELELARPHGQDLPILMDATVDQSDGFRFFYTLPLAEDRLLVEDTYFHHSPKLEPELLRDEILQYTEAKGHEVVRVIREETGVLPMPWSGRLPAGSSTPLVAGYQGGWFHPATGYSLPVAARLAELVAGQDPNDLAARLGRLAREHSGQARYCHILNRFLFLWYAPPQRWHIFERFYRLPLATISRFYALQLTAADRVRLLIGRPPRGLSLRHRLHRRGHR